MLRVRLETVVVAPVWVVCNPNYMDPDTAAGRCTTTSQTTMYHSSCELERCRLQHETYVDKVQQDDLHNQKQIYQHRCVGCTSKVASLDEGPLSAAQPCQIKNEVYCNGMQSKATHGRNHTKFSPPVLALATHHSEKAPDAQQHQPGSPAASGSNT